MDSDLRTALVVDDNYMIVMHAVDILEDAGVHALTAHSADVALGILEQHADQITLLFTDVEMPGSKDGFALARQTTKCWPWIGILVASGERHHEEGDLPNGAIFVGKPFSVEVVHDRLRQLLSDDQKPEPLKR